MGGINFPNLMEWNGMTDTDAVMSCVCYGWKWQFRVWPQILSKLVSQEPVHLPRWVCGPISISNARFSLFSNSEVSQRRVTLSHRPKTKREKFAKIIAISKILNHPK